MLFSVHHHFMASLESNNFVLSLKVWIQNADNTEVWYLLPFKDYRAVVLATFYSDGESIFKDVTDNYKKTYPHIKKVELQAICAIEELEPDK